MPRIVAIPASKLRKVFEKAGFKCVRTEGDHFVYTKRPRLARSAGIYNQKQSENRKHQQRRIF